MSNQDLATMPLSLRRQMKPPITGALWGLSFLLMGLTLLLRGRGLGAMPMLGEEALAIRLAGALKRYGITPEWQAEHTSMPALWPWILSHLHLVQNPLLAARWVAVIFGALLLPLSLLVWVNLGRLFRHATPADASPGTIGLVGAILLLVCPYLALVQRVATFDSFYVAQTMAAAWLSLRLAVGYLDGVSVGGAMRRGLAVGVVLLLALFTNATFAWGLLTLPFAALLAAWVTRRAAPGQNATSSKPRGVRSFAAAGLAVALAALIYASTVHGPESIPAISLSRIGSNLLTLLIPMDHTSSFANDSIQYHLAFHPILDRGWYPVYLTPPVFILALLAWPRLWGRRERGAAVFLGLWLLATLGPVVLLLPDNGISRAGAPAALPLLMGAAFILTDLIFTLSISPRPVILRWTLCLLIAGTALIWPAIATHRQTLDWHLQTGISADLTHNAGDASAGVASQGAQLFLLRTVQPPDLLPLVLLLPSFPGNPADSLRLLLDKPMLRKLIEMHDLPDLAKLPPAGARTFWVAQDRLAPGQAKDETFSDGVPVYLALPTISRMTVQGQMEVLVRTPAGLVPEARLLDGKGELVGVFSNGNNGDGSQSGDYVRIYLLSRGK